MTLKKLGLVVAGLLIGLLLSELGTRLVESKLNNVQVSGAWFGQIQTMPDPKLGLRVVPNSPGHDANGFRNAMVPVHADIVAIGDSQTWGQNATVADAWPQKLGQLSGMTVYNMGMSGYGPVEYLILTDDAFKFSPKFIVVGLYFGNDLWDAYHAVYSRDAFIDLRKPDLVGPLSTDVVADKANDIVEQTNQLSDNIRKETTWRWAEWLGRNSAIGRELSSRGRWPGQTADAKNAALRKAIERIPSYGVAYDGAHTRTILSTSYRLAALDRSEIRIREGLRITKIALGKIKDRTDKEKTELLVLLIPTKELVFSQKVKELGKVDATYATLIEMETTSRDEIREYCAARNITVVDALPNLASAIENAQQIYPEGVDGHPNAAGYSVIAQTVNAGITQRLTAHNTDR